MPYDHYYDINRPLDYIDDKPHSPYGTSSDDISSGVRKTLNTCQYWIKGMPGVCTHWKPGDPGSCSYSRIDNVTKLTIYPSGYNQGKCDLLGRKYGCDQYEATSEDLEQYVCVATCPYRSGLWKRENENDPWRSVKSSEIRGHNADSDFIGRCDGCGFGRGQTGWDYSGNGEDCQAEAFVKLPVVCNYYRPYHMAFGAKVPKTSTLGAGSLARRDKETGRFLEDERDYYDERLPFSFKVYNVRAKLQKCAYWDAEESGDFVIDTAGLYLESGDQCSNPDEVVTPYHTEATESPPADMLLENVWAEAGGIICNGARTDCPGYTGRWIYCVDELMDKGDKISAQQILELRFWMNDWASKEEYDSVFKRPPNRHDPDTSDIYTYHRWQTLSTSPQDSILLGKRCCLCVPNVRNEFSKDIIQVEEIKFINKGTSAPSSGELQFPSLIRDIEDWAYPPLNIVYPYASKDPFDEDLNQDPCSDANDEDIVPCVKRCHSVDGDAISVVGWTVRNTDVYVFNAQTLKEKSVTIPNIIKENTSSLAIQKQADIIELDEKMWELIDELTKKGLIYKSSSDINGLFVVGPVDITYQKLNELYVAYKYGYNWYFRKRNVWSQWHGGVIIQSTFRHEYVEGAYIDDGYHTFTPPATATAKMYPMHGTNKYDCETQSAGAFGALRQLVWSSATNYGYNYTYCIKKKTIENFIVDRWKRVDNAGTIWLEISDTNLNHIFEWGISNITAERPNDDGSSEIIDMGQVLPTGNHQQINIHANACMIAPSNSSIKKGFFEEAGWTIKLDYWYKYIANDNNEGAGVEVVFPPTDDSLVRFSGLSYVLETSNNTITATQIQQNTVAVCGKFVDEDGRLIGIFATKLIMDVARVLCRDVEIVYGWSAEGTNIEVRPQQGFLRRTQDGPFYKARTGPAGGGSTPPCGDHEISPFGGQGPMWFPYDSCDNYAFYDIWTGANSVVKPFEGCPREDLRMQGPTLNLPWCSPHSTLWDCAEDWGCGFVSIEPSSTLFTGFAYMRGRVNAEIYAGFGWALPKFGNVLRDQVERFRSIDNISHITFKGQEPVPSVAWAPLVMDDSCFFSDFNSIDGNYLQYVNQLNFMQLTTLVSESLPSEDDRNSFDSVFGLRRMALASYPEPLTEDPAIGTPYVAYYYFKSDSTQWAWQEKWKDIEIEEGTLGMAAWEKPEYIFDKDKMEHRFVPTEGVYTVGFTAPVFDDAECKLTKWPSLQLGDGKERYFKCVYSDYNSDLVEWEDENEGQVDGSGGGSEDKGIYEKTTANSNWIHSKPEYYPGLDNMLYDSEATDSVGTARSNGCEIVLSYDKLLQEGEVYVYNRGLIANVYKNALKYMPFEENSLVEGSDYDISYDPMPDIDVSGAPASWEDTYTVNINLTFKNECKPCVSKIEISGYKGNYMVGESKINIGQPYIYIYENNEPTELASARAVYQTQAEKNSGIGTELWTKELKLEVNPTRMLGSDPPNKATRTQTLRIKLQSPDGISIRNIAVYGAKYIDGTDRIKVYERKYLVSTGSYGGWNPDGEQRVLSYEYNRDNSGVYFFDNNIGSGAGQGYNKMKSIFCGEDKEDKEEFEYDIKREGQVHKAESEQVMLYEKARSLDRGETTTYKTVIPPNLAEFFRKVGASSGTLVGQTVTLLSELRNWDNVPGTDSYERYNLWYPKGYQYDWSDHHKLTKCYIVGPIRKVAQLAFIEMSTGDTKAAATGLQSYYTLRSWHMLQKTEKDLMIGSDSAAAANSPNWGGALDLMCNDRSRG